MKSNGFLLDTKTFDIIDIDDDSLLVVNRLLAKSVSLLNKKGYYTDIASIPSLTTLFSIMNLLHELIEKKLINTKGNEDIIKNILKNTIHESIIIVFNENYNFKVLPKGYIYRGIYDHTDLFYNINILKDSNNIEFKELVEIDHEIEKCIEHLEEWAEKLPYNTGGNHE